MGKRSAHFVRPDAGTGAAGFADWRVGCAAIAHDPGGGEGRSMSATGLEIFDKTLQVTHVWLNEIADELPWADRHRAYVALRAVLHTLRDRLTVEEASDLGAQLPMLVRGIYYEGWNPAKTPDKKKLPEFLDSVGSHFRQTAVSNANPEQVTRAVFRVLSKHVSEGEIADVRQMLPKDLQALWA
jgi:uncharacterized protein (DUF2267 family)